ncbi:MAG: secretin N-terminal domain-containing protein, partial [bacterium]
AAENPPAPEPSAEAAPEAPEAPAAQPAGAVQAPASSVTSQIVAADGRPEYLRKAYNFNLKGAEWKDVLEYFSRATGLSIVGDTQDLTGTVDFFHQRPMTFKDAFSFLNRLLTSQAQPRIALLRKDYIQVIKISGSGGWLRVLDVDHFYEGYEAFKAADLGDDEKCVVFYTPTNADAGDLFEQCRQFAPDMTMLIQPMGESNTLIVSGAAADVDRWLQIVQRPMADDQRPMKRFVLKNAVAGDARNIIQQMFPTGGGARPVPQPGQPGQARSGGGGDKIDIAVDDKANALLIKATPRKLEEIGKFIEQLDIDLPDDATMACYKLEHARAEELANTLRQLFASAGQPKVPGRSSGQWWRRSAGASSVAVLIVPDGGTNTLLVTADKDAQKEIKDLVARFDVEDAAGSIRRIPLTEARCEQVVEVLRQAFLSIMRPQGAKGSPLTITPDTVNNAIVAAGEPQYLDRVADAVKQLDQASTNQALEHVVNLKSARPSEVSNALTGIFANQPGRPNNPVRFLPIETAGVLICIAPPSDWERIEPVIQMIDKQAEVGSPQLTSIPLEHADATEMAQILTDLFPETSSTQLGQFAPRFGMGMRGGMGGGPGGMPGMPPGMGSSSNQSQRQLQQTTVHAVADPRTNSVIVSAASATMDQIRRMVEQLDSRADKKQKVYVYKLDYADVENVSEILRNMFENTAYGSNNRTSRSSSTSGATGNTLSNRTMQNTNTMQFNSRSGSGN